MYLSHTVRSRPCLCALAAGLIVLIAGSPAFAQSGLPFAQLTRGYAIAQALMDYHQEARALPQATVPPWARSVPVREVRYVAIRDASGQVRYFEIEGPIEVVPKFHPGVVTHYYPR
jgi:hypothetical protein